MLKGKSYWSESGIFYFISSPLLISLLLFFLSYDISVTPFSASPQACLLRKLVVCLSSCDWISVYWQICYLICSKTLHRHIQIVLILTVTLLQLWFLTAKSRDKFQGDYDWMCILCASSIFFGYRIFWADYHSTIAPFSPVILSPSSRCQVVVIRQHIIISSVFKWEGVHLWSGTWPVTD